MLVEHILDIMVVGFAIWCLFNGVRDSRISSMNARATRFLEGIKGDLVQFYYETKVSDRRVSVTLMDKDVSTYILMNFNMDFRDRDEMYLCKIGYITIHKTFKKSASAAELIAEVRSLFSLPSGVS